MAAMAEERGFLGRWSARKRAVREAETPIESRPEGLAEPVAVVEPELEIDPAELPPLDSIKSGVDVQAFLQRGVPKALRQAALRRWWAADPSIRDFKELADYDWDFNAPGYGDLLPGDDPQAVAEKLFEAMRRRVADDDVAPRSDPPQCPPVAAAVADPRADDTAAIAGETPAPSSVSSAVDPGAVENDASRRRRRRRHGSAMPR